MKRRFFKAEALEHVYQRAANRGVIFYSELDFLMYLTILGVTAQKYRVRIISICLMVDHVHLLIEAESYQDLYKFIQDCTSQFALEYNYSIGRSGSLWQRPYGMALKKGDKAKRTAIAYVNNNGVEKELSTRTEGYRWNLLKYYNCAHPYSEPIESSTPSQAMKKALSLVRMQHSLNRPLGYPLLVKLFSKLREGERRQLSDHIVSLYNAIDYEAAISYYGDYPTMILALNSNTGSEYELHEEYSQSNDLAYPEIAGYIKDRLGLKNPRSVIMVPADQRSVLLSEITDHGIASDYQARKYLHLPLSH